MKIDTEKNVIEIGGINLSIKEFDDGAIGTGFKIEIRSGMRLLKVGKLRGSFEPIDIIVKSELPNEKYVNSKLLKATEETTEFYKILLEIRE